MGENITTKQNTVASNVSGNLPQSQQVNDSPTLVKKFFNSYYTKPLEFNSNEVDATIGFFEKRGFDKTSAPNNCNYNYATSKNRWSKNF